MAVDARRANGAKAKNFMLAFRLDSVRELEKVTEVNMNIVLVVRCVRDE